MEEKHLSRRQQGISDAGGSPSTSGRSADNDSSSEPDVDMQVPGPCAVMLLPLLELQL